MRSLGWTTDLMVRRLMGSNVEEQDGVIVVRTPRVPDFHWGNFLLLPGPPGAADADAVERRFGDAFPGATHRTVGVDGATGMVGHPAVAMALGAQPELTLVMTATSLPPVEPLAAALSPAAGSALDSAGQAGQAGQAEQAEQAEQAGQAGQAIEVRRLNPDEDADWDGLVALRADTDGDNEATRGYYRRRAAEARDAVAAGFGGWWVVTVDGTIRAELGIFSDGSGLARYQHVGTHPGFRRRRFASALVSAAGRWALESLPSVRTLVILADPGGAGAAVYGRLGFAVQEWAAQLYRRPAT